MVLSNRGVSGKVHDPYFSVRARICRAEVGGGRFLFLNVRMIVQMSVLGWLDAFRAVNWVREKSFLRI